MPVHPFPARMAPAVALNAMSRTKHHSVVLDPMMGSGTVIAVAQSRGMIVKGFDTDPLAVLLTSVWTTPLKVDLVRLEAEQVLISARKLAENMTLRDAYPCSADRETKQFIRYWFDPQARRQLKSLSNQISSVENDDIRNALWCAFSRLIITKQAGASLAMDLSHSRPHRVFKKAPVLPFDRFITSTEIVIKNTPSQRETVVRNHLDIGRADARYLPVEESSVDLVLTSPPYLNAIDYIRCNKFTLVWMGHSVNALSGIRSNNVGSEVTIGRELRTGNVSAALDSIGRVFRLPNRHQGIVERYLHDMNKVIAEISRVLKPGGRSVIVIGDCHIKGEHIDNSRALITLAQLAGLSFGSIETREIPPNRRYLPPPRNRGGSKKINSRMRFESIIHFTK